MCRYRTLSRVFGDGVSTRVVLIKCLCDQIFFATQQDFLFLGLCAYNDSAQLPAALDEVRMTFLPTWLMDCSLWPLVNFIGFSAIPSTLQPTYMAFIQFFWQVYVSSLAAKDPHHHAKGEEPDLSELKGIFYKIDIDHVSCANLMFVVKLTLLYLRCRVVSLTVQSYWDILNNVPELTTRVLERNNCS